MGRGGGGQAGEKNKETVTASLCLVFNGCGGIFSPPLIKQSPPLAKNQGNMIRLLRVAMRL